MCRCVSGVESYGMGLRHNEELRIEACKTGPCGSCLCLLVLPSRNTLINNYVYASLLGIGGICGNVARHVLLACSDGHDLILHMPQLLLCSTSKLLRYVGSVVEVVLDASGDLDIEGFDLIKIKDGIDVTQVITNQVILQHDVFLAVSIR